MVGAAWLATPFALHGDEKEFAAANQLLLTGKYEEAAEAFQKIAAGDSNEVAAAIGESRCLAARGKRDAAAKRLHAAAEKSTASAELAAELATLAFERGDYAASERFVQQSLATAPRLATARWIAAELHRTAGRREEAQAGYEWLVDRYNTSATIEDPDSLLAIGRGAAQFARWRRNASQFDFLVNRFYPKLGKKHPKYWRARLEMGLLFLEKYNLPAAAAEFDAALALNPQAAEAHVAQGRVALRRYDLAAVDLSLQRALEIDPDLIGALQLQGDRYVAGFRPDLALRPLLRARMLHPYHEETLGRIAAVYGLLDGLKADEPPARMQEAIAAAVARNRQCGEFFFVLASQLDSARAFPAAARYYREALERMPELTEVRGELGLMLMRLGEEGAAEPLLRESLRVDPFNVRVRNTVAVLDVLKNYAVVETEHFIVKFDRGADAILARHAAEYLEAVYPELTKRLGYTPTEKSLFEIFSRTTATSGHGWFSARMVGLPYIGTVGACAGRVVAIVSPNDMPQRFNWARVLRHEFTHVLNLQQTDFRIPHWFTEALAVWHEDTPRPREWLRVLAARQAQKKLFNLETIHDGFIRPANSHDWTLAYCQSELYAEFMLNKYGSDALTKMLAAYRDNLTTPAAIERSFGVEPAEFERLYLEFVAGVVAQEGAPREGEEQGEESSLTLAQWREKRDAAPHDAKLNARMALECLQRSHSEEAQKFATEALRLDRHQGMAAFVLARLSLSKQNPAEAIQALEDALDERNPNAMALSLLAGLKLKGGDAATAARWYELGLRQFPADVSFPKALARLYLQTGNRVELARVLERLAVLDGDDPLPRRKLARLNLEAGNFAGAVRWGNEALHIDVRDAETHADLGAAYLGQANGKGAIREFETAIQLGGDDADWHLGLAEAHRAEGQTAMAIDVLRGILRREPQHAVAAKRLGELEARP